MAGGTVDEAMAGGGRGEVGMGEVGMGEVGMGEADMTKAVERLIMAEDEAAMAGGKQ